VDRTWRRHSSSRASWASSKAWAPKTKVLFPSRSHRQPWKGQMIRPSEKDPDPLASSVARWRQALKYPRTVSASTRTTRTDWSQMVYST